MGEKWYKDKDALWDDQLKRYTSWLESRASLANDGNTSEGSIDGELDRTTLAFRAPTSPSGEVPAYGSPRDQPRISPTALSREYPYPLNSTPRRAIGKEHTAGLDSRLNEKTQEKKQEKHKRHVHCEVEGCPCNGATWKSHGDWSEGVEKIKEARQRAFEHLLYDKHHRLMKGDFRQGNMNQKHWEEFKADLTTKWLKGISHAKPTDPLQVKKEEHIIAERLAALEVPENNSVLGGGLQLVDVD